MKGVSIAVSDRAPRKRPGESAGEQSHRGEARRFLGTEMQESLIRGIRRCERARAWTSVANEKFQNGEIDADTVELVGSKAREVCSDE